MSEKHSSSWRTHSYLSLLSLLCLLFSTHSLLFFSSFLSICTFWSLGSNKCHTASFTLTGGQFRSQTTQRWLVRGHPSYLGPRCFHHALSIHCIPSFSHFQSYLLIFIFISWLSVSLYLTLANYHIFLSFSPLSVSVLHC